MSNIFNNIFVIVPGIFNNIKNEHNNDAYDNGFKNPLHT